MKRRAKVDTRPSQLRSEIRAILLRTYATKERVIAGKVAVADLHPAPGRPSKAGKRRRQRRKARHRERQGAR